MTLASALKKMLSQGVAGNQAQLVKALQEQGIHTTQSSVSRTLKKINAVRFKDGWGRIVYTLARNESRLREMGFFDSLVVRISHNRFQIVIQTRPGTANTVAKFIDDHGFDQVLGSVAGDDTIFIAPVDVDRIDKTLHKIASYMKKIGIFVA